MNIPWDKIIEMIISLIEGCMAEGRSESEIKRSIQEPTVLDWWRLRRQIKSETGLYGRPLQDVMDNLRIEHNSNGPRGCGDFADTLIAAAKDR